MLGSRPLLLPHGGLFGLTLQRRHCDFNKQQLDQNSTHQSKWTTQYIFFPIKYFSCTSVLIIMHNPLPKLVFCTGGGGGAQRQELCMWPFSLVLWVVPAVPSSPSPAVPPAWPWSHPHQGQPSPAQHTSIQSIWHVTKYHTVTSTCHKIPQSLSCHKMPQLTLHVGKQADQRNDCKTQELFERR